MIYYTYTQIADIFGLSKSRLMQLMSEGRGPTRTRIETVHGKRGRPRISTADAIAWGESQIERLSSSVLTEKDADRYVAGCRRLRVEDFMAQVRSHQQPKALALTAKVKRRGPGMAPHDIVPVSLPSRN